MCEPGSQDAAGITLNGLPKIVKWEYYVAG
jgi:hypothetical protein